MGPRTRGRGHAGGEFVAGRKGGKEDREGAAGEEECSRRTAKRLQLLPVSPLKFAVKLFTSSVGCRDKIREDIPTENFIEEVILDSCKGVWVGVLLGTVVRPGRGDKVLDGRFSAVEPVGSM